MISAGSRRVISSIRSSIVANKNFRSFSTTPSAMMNPLDQFRDLVPREERETEKVGRSWSVKELRRKSYDDLNKLWYVLYKEKNMLSTEAHFARRNQAYMVQPERKKKVQKSMAAIKAVLGERKIEKINAHKLLKAEKEEGEEEIAVIEEIADTEEKK
eukprot:117548_1